MAVDLTDFRDYSEYLYALGDRARLTEEKFWQRRAKQKKFCCVPDSTLPLDQQTRRGMRSLEIQANRLLRKAGVTVEKVE
jgi:hypothetical protein